MPWCLIASVIGMFLQKLDQTNSKIKTTLMKSLYILLYLHVMVRNNWKIMRTCARKRCISHGLIIMLLQYLIPATGTQILKVAEEKNRKISLFPNSLRNERISRYCQKPTLVPYFWLPNSITLSFVCVCVSVKCMFLLGNISYKICF